MKRKTLGIAISLALLSSLFVFAAPVGAGPENAAPEAEKTEFDMFLSGFTGGAYTHNFWLNDHIQKVGYILTYDILPGSTFGTGEATFWLSEERNFKVGKRTTKAVVQLVYKDGATIIGTLTYNRQNQADWDGTAWIRRASHASVIDATGVCEGFHFSDFAYGPSTGAFEDFVAHFAPKQ